MSQTKVTDNLRDTTQLDATKITTGTIPEARITSLDATKLTGNIANARIPASAVTQHVTGFDDSSIRADILKLALSQAVDGNRVAYNLEDSFVDGFEDDSGITTETMVNRDTTSEYVSSVYQTVGAATEWDYVTNNVTLNAIAGGTGIDGTSIVLGNTSLAAHLQALWGTLSGGSQSTYWASPSQDYGSGITTDFGASYLFSKFSVGKARSYGDLSSFRIRYSNDGTSWTVLDMTGASVDSYHGSTSPLPPSGGGEVTNFDSTGVMNWETTGSSDRNVAAIISGFTEFSARHLQLEIGSWSNNGNGNVGFSNWRWWYKPTTTTTNATGTLISDTQTASTSRTSASGVIIYEDAAGTNTLGTDLKIYFTANNGTNWAEAASYGTATTYSGTKKLVKLGATTCTAGTQVAMKAVWANQASSVTGGYQSGDRSSTITVTTTISEASGTVAKLVDGNAPIDGSHGGSNSFYWATGSNNVVGQELKFQWSSAQTITGAKMLSANTDSQGTWKWQGSNNGSAWTDIGSNFNFDTATTKVWDTTFGSELSGNTTAYTYYRMYGVSGSTNGNPWWIEIEFYHAAIAGKEARLHGWAVNY